MTKVGTTNEANRIEWVKNTLAKIPAGLTILDAGAGECQFKKYCSHLTYISQDFSQYHGKGVIGLQTKKWDISNIGIVSDITNIPLKDASVDAVMCTEVLEHIPNPVDAIVEFNRLIKPGGYLILTAPFTSLTHFAPYHFATGFSRFFYEKHLPENNFVIDEIEFNGNYFEYLAQENRRIPYVARKYAKGINIFQKAIIYMNLLLLAGLSKKERNSSELLCFGLHVFGRRK